ncbi:hypothetical protein [Sediminivirga luteola]|uniref:Glucosamine kinase n=1 Tax=Sediminivirga luteola TaxID=1774748 RepID=A0A8J2TXP6_9MICO|nr:hypothetical protein [Sediminivirga luteola]GGA13030.1 hypothetical protein GCM10011333_14930 [Sediminivirga luteola]
MTHATTSQPVLHGSSPSVAGVRLEVVDGRVTAGGRRPRAGDGLARELARRVDPAVGAAAPENAIDVDQTQTSVIVDGRYVVKIAGHWGACDRATVLLSRLADAGCRDVPALAGQVGWEHPVHGTGTLALVSEFLPGTTDGWTWAVDELLAAHRTGGTDGAGGSGGVAGPEPAWAVELGRAVGRVHAILAGRGSAGAGARPEPEDAPLERRRRAERLLAEATRDDNRDDAGADPAAGSAAAARLQNRVGPLREALTSLADRPPGLAFPLHGDLHIGQVLRDPAGRIALIDFDGDPQLDSATRWRAEPAARDVAHMLVSLDLVAAVAQKRLGRAEPSLFAHAERAGRGFLAGYRAALGPDADSLLDEGSLPGLRAEQLLAEVRYAQRFLPRWRYAPDAVIAHRYPSTADLPEEPWTPPPSAPIST